MNDTLKRLRAAFTIVALGLGGAYMLTPDKDPFETYEPVDTQLPNPNIISDRDDKLNALLSEKELSRRAGMPVILVHPDELDNKRLREPKDDDTISVTQSFEIVSGPALLKADAKLNRYEQLMDLIEKTSVASSWVARMADGKQVCLVPMQDKNIIGAIDNLTASYICTNKYTPVLSTNIQQTEIYPVAFLNAIDDVRRSLKLSDDEVEDNVLGQQQSYMDTYYLNLAGLPHTEHCQNVYADLRNRHIETAKIFLMDTERPKTIERVKAAMQTKSFTAALLYDVTRSMNDQIRYEILGNDTRKFRDFVDKTERFPACSGPGVAPRP
jgi:hypothetical protein